MEQLQEKLSASEAAARATEANMKKEMDAIMKLWEEAQRTAAAEAEALQDRICELNAELADACSAQRRLEARQDDDYGF